MYYFRRRARIIRAQCVISDASPRLSKMGQQSLVLKVASLASFVVSTNIERRAYIDCESMCVSSLLAKKKKKKKKKCVFPGETSLYHAAGFLAVNVYLKRQELAARQDEDQVRETSESHTKKSEEKDKQRALYKSHQGEKAREKLIFA